MKFPVMNVEKVNAFEIINQSHNPNIQTKADLEFLHQSILDSGFTQPLVIRKLYPNEYEFYNMKSGESNVSKDDKFIDNANIKEENLNRKDLEILGDLRPNIEAKYRLIDGAHRLYVVKHFADIGEIRDYQVPVVVNEFEDPSDEMASTILHNIHGENDGTLTINIVKTLIKAQKSDRWILQHMGNMVPDEDTLYKIKQIAGINDVVTNADGFDNNIDKVITFDTIPDDPYLELLGEDFVKKQIDDLNALRQKMAANKEKYNTNLANIITTLND